MRHRYEFILVSSLETLMLFYLALYFSIAMLKHYRNMD